MEMVGHREYVKRYHPMVVQDFPGGSDGKASAYNAGDPGSIPGLRRSPGEGNGKELDTIERLHFHFQQ